MQTTTNYGLKKPETSDSYDKANDNGNMDIIDTELKANADAQAAHLIDTDPHAAAGFAKKGATNIFTQQQVIRISNPALSLDIVSGGTRAYILATSDSVENTNSRLGYDTVSKEWGIYTTSALAGKLWHAGNLAVSSGTFTPVLFGSSVSGVNTYAVQTGFYTKIGARVFFDLFISLTAKDVAMSGDARISGLPFATKTTTNYRPSGAIGSYENFDLSPTLPYFYWLMTNTSSNLLLRQTGDNILAGAVSSNQIQNNTVIQISGSYEAAA